MRRHPIVEIEDMQEPFCGVRRKTLVTLADAEPEIAEEWLYEKNAGWGPEHISRGSGVRAWWQCRFCLRDYKAQINNRTSQGSACPYCASKRVCDENSFVMLFPEVAAEWHPKKNGKRKAEEFTKFSGKRAWWKCKTCKHAWETAIADRTLLESGCPACYEARMEYARLHPKITIQPPVILSETGPVSREWYKESNGREFVSLASFSRRIAKQWHPNKNGDWTPADFARGSSAIVWWRCQKGADHEWQAEISSRTRAEGSGCPFCSGRKVSTTNSLQTLFPETAKEWHPTKNGKLTPADVTGGSNERFWWRCSKNKEHEWDSRVAARTSNNRKCPYCAHQRVSKENCLSTHFPSLAAQLHPMKNGDLTADKIAVRSRKKIWWICKKGADHIWQATPANRTGRGSGCPFCSGRQASISNCLATLDPETAKLWDKKKNGKLTPANVTQHSKRVVWWICKKGHSWQQAIGGRCSSMVICWGCSDLTQPGVPSISHQTIPKKTVKKK